MRSFQNVCLKIHTVSINVVKRFKLAKASLKLKFCSLDQFFSRSSVNTVYVRCNMSMKIPNLPSLQLYLATSSPGPYPKSEDGPGDEVEALRWGYT